MDTSCLFTAALQLRGPWKVGSVDFRDAGDGGRGLHIMIGFEPGVRFHCPETGCRGVPVLFCFNVCSTGSAVFFRSVG